MSKYKLIPSLLLVVFLACSSALVVAQDGNPTVAFLRYGSMQSIDMTEDGVLDILEAYGHISAEENRLLGERENFEGDNLNIIWGDAGFDLASVNFIIEEALDQGADVLVTISVPVTLAAINLTLDMDDPPPVLFTFVYEPYEVGIADASCIKPDHITGAESITNYEEVFDSLKKQHPSMSMIGVVVDTSSVTSEYSAARIATLAAEHDIDVVETGVVGLPDLQVAANSLIERGAEALILPVDFLTTFGLPVLTSVANENDVPIFHPSMGAISLGATFGIGFMMYYDQGSDVGLMLAHYLNGELDVASTAIHIREGSGLGVNLDSASEQEVEISNELMSDADLVFSGGRFVRASQWVLDARNRRGVIVPLEDRLEADLAWLDALRCTPELIAEQEAALEAGE